MCLLDSCREEDADWSQGSDYGWCLRATRHIFLAVKVVYGKIMRKFVSFYGEESFLEISSPMSLSLKALNGESV
ncbi:hypothetical protein CEXT_27331 [Caerostris extrusa]|uniref:Uncharacterized protein n=1 Tax=Caerostris extrusa TaxID=172846 RepID=A0AAV4X2L2_CAEEX|nr:hypothetical protein CEXT_27331 [Caerostris extrusa]